MKILFIIFLLTTSIYGYDKFFGSNNCAQCHTKQYNKWKASPHYKADEKLTEKQKKNPKCISCHQPSKDKGVSCESCHGNGQHYAKTFVMKDKKLSKMVGLKKVNQQTCNKCHNKYTTKGKKDIKSFKDICGKK